MKEKLNHCCKDVCSGWQDGYEKGFEKGNVTYKEHIWYNITEDQLFLTPFTPTNYMDRDMYYFNVKFWDKCIYVDEL